jgi:hypothetical protein
MDVPVAALAAFVARGLIAQEAVDRLTTITWYHRPEKREDWVAAFCGPHAEEMAAFGFKPGPGDLPELKNEVPPCCVMCGDRGPAFREEVRRCRCVAAPSRCRAHRRKWAETFGRREMRDRALAVVELDGVELAVEPLPLEDV